VTQTNFKIQLSIRFYRRRFSFFSRNHQSAIRNQYHPFILSIKWNRTSL